MKKIELKSRHLLRNMFKCLSFTAMAFVFQACYGMPPEEIDNSLDFKSDKVSVRMPVIDGIENGYLENVYTVEN